MTRRELLKLITIATGTALIGGELVFTACSRDKGFRSINFGQSELDLMNEIGETILPRTSTPGAKDANVAEFMAKTVDNCYFEDDQQAFKSGLKTIEELSNSRFGKSFMQISTSDRTALLTDLDAEAKAYIRPENGTNHYFTMLKQLTLMGFFTSEIGQTKVLRHVPIPGRYDGCIPYNEGETAWALG
jgi:hypothetical protein